MYRFGNLPGNLIAFCDVLRREHGFRIGAGESHDGARALEVVPLASEKAVRNALRPIFSRTRDETTIFDRVFTEFFFPRPEGHEQIGVPPVRRDLESEPAEDAQPPESKRSGGGRIDEGGPDAQSEVSPSRMTAASETAAARLARVSYSPLQAERVDAGPELTPVDAAWQEAARALVHRLHLGLSRRWRPARRGRRFDLRRTLRASLQTGGEPLVARWRSRPRRTPRLVLLIDGSRSMEMYSAAGLQTAVAIASVTLRVDAFTFSTSLRRVTDEVRRAAAGARLRLARMEYSWGGGTNIGASLHEFLHRFGQRGAARDTVIVVVSDGLDVGDPALLRDAMQTIARRSAAVVWLNPLLDTPGYEPTVAGMRAALPYITTFASVRHYADLARLSRTIRVRG
ncbi:MAG TPA: VWA domain-containing protein [Vicinamibacterales bacterium]|jgi:hypothetical protein